MKAVNFASVLVCLSCHYPLDHYLMLSMQTSTLKFLVYTFRNTSLIYNNNKLKTLNHCLRHTGRRYYTIITYIISFSNFNITQITYTCNLGKIRVINYAIRVITTFNCIIYNSYRNFTTTTKLYFKHI